MAKWVYNRPLDCCDETELRVAKLLARLPDEWVVRWGYYYEKDREGDFLILGPHGGLLVLEVKGGQIRRLGSTGCWEGEARDHPVAQLGAGFTGGDPHRSRTFSQPGRRAEPDGLFHGGQSSPPAAGGGALRPADLTSWADGRGDETRCRMTRAALLKGPPLQTQNCEFGRACVPAAACELVPHDK